MAGTARASRPTPHVMYVIDEICEMGGAELALLQMVRKLPPERFRVSVVTFRIDARTSRFCKSLRFHCTCCRCGGPTT